MSNNGTNPSNNPKNLDITTPIGINLSEYKNENNWNEMNVTTHFISQKNDMPIIKDLTSEHKSIIEILSKRKNTLENLSNLWQKGNINEILVPVSQLKDLGVANDFFNYAFMQNNINKDYLKPEQSVYFLPVIVTLINSKYETNFRVGIKMVCMLFDCYSNSIESAVKNNNYSSQKTKESYTTLINFFDEITKNQRVLGRDLNKDKNLNALLEEMKDFCRKCKK